MITNKIILLIGLLASYAYLAKGDIQQLCESDFSLNCVRDYFSKHSDFERVNSGNDSPMYDVKLPIYVPYADLIVVASLVYPSKLEGNLEKFYYDDSTGNLVHSIRFEHLTCEAPEIIFSISREGKEPITFKTHVKATYPTDTVVTAILPVAEGITVDSYKDANITAYFTNTDVVLDIGSEYTDSEDPVVAASYNSLFQDILTVVQEIFRTKASFYYLIHLENYVCKSGISPDLQNRYDTTVFDNIIANDNGQDSITRPCDESDDLGKCVFEYFETNGDCSPIKSPNDDPIHRKRLNTYVPCRNATAIPVDALLTGLTDGVIKDFFMNEATNNLVLTIDFPSIGMYSPNLPLIIYKRGAQPKVVSDSNKDTYGVILTAIIPIENGLNSNALEKAVVTPYINDPSSLSFEFGPSISQSSDPDVISQVEGASEIPITITKELFVTESKSMFLAYMENSICDFEVPWSAMSD